ncbi:MAG: cyclase family protein, partial [Rhodobacteraceae bacterium]|nr:cyclase family protein [Paracoccaceae bacterium]
MSAIGGIVDMQQPIQPGMALWPGDPEPGFKSIAADGYFLREFSIAEHSGTHVNAADSFIDGLAAQDAYTGKVFPAVVIDVRAEAATNPDYALSREKVAEWEAAHGHAPAGSLV